MARSFGRILVAIWDDDDFRALSGSAQRMYLFLLTQADLEHSGLIPLRERRWAKSCGSLTADQVTLDLKDLATARFIVVDEDTEELLVRSLIRRDEVWKQPNVYKAAAASAVAAQSPAIKAVLYAETARLDLSSAAEDSRRVREGLLVSLEPFAKGIGNPSGGVGEGLARGTLHDQGERGEGYGSSDGFPLSPYPVPLKDTAGDPAAAQPTAPPREDVERLCAHLADRIEGNGSRRPAVTQRWRDAARLMLDNDRRTEQQIRAAIDWCQDDEFWRRNVMSMPKLREQYDRLRLQAQDKAKRGPNGGQRNGHTRWAPGSGPFLDPDRKYESAEDIVV